MPAFVTHSLFGEEVPARVKNPELRRLISRYRCSYQWGLQGPDLLFYHGAVLKKNLIPGYGNRMHDEKTARLFKVICRYLTQMRGRPGFDALLAYTMGFCCHYVLDRETHPFIFCRQEEYFADDPRRSHSGVHYRLESDIDSALHLNRKGRPVGSFSLQEYFRVSRAEREAIARWYRRVLWETYGVLAPAGEVKACFRDALAAVRFLLGPAEGPALFLSRCADRLSRRRGHIEGHVRIQEPRGDPLNLSRFPWHHLGRPEVTRRESFLQLYESAQAEAALLMEQMLKTVREGLPWPEEDMLSFSNGALK